MTPADIRYKKGTHAGELDSEALAEIWDHVDLDEPPNFDTQLLAFFQAVNGVAPTNLWFQDDQIVRFLNFCNDYYPPNASIVDWQIVRVRSWIADRLNPLQIPFAELPHGNYLCFDFSDRSSPAIVRWDHEGSTAASASCQSVANSLNDFLSQLQHR